jgi:hypothetical protein
MQTAFEARQAQAKAKLEALRLVADRDPAPLRAALDDAETACREFANARQGQSIDERNAAVALDGRRSEARRAVHEDEEERRDAQRAIPALEFAADPVGHVDRARDAHRGKCEVLADAIAKLYTVRAGLPKLTASAADAAQRANVQRERFEEGMLDAALAGRAFADDRMAGCEAEAKQLAALEARARSRLTTLETTVADLRNELAAGRDAYLATRARLAMARWDALTDVLAEHLVEYGAACRILHRQPALPSIDDLRIARRVAEIAGELPPVPAHTSETEQREAITAPAVGEGHEAAAA